MAITSPLVTGKDKSWEGYNSQGASASFHTLAATFVKANAAACLGAGVSEALAFFPRAQYSAPGTYSTVQWKVAKVVGTESDAGVGRALEGGLTDMVGGSTSGSTCSEHALWDAGGGFFDRRCAVYVLRVNLAPCLRCCASIAAIATDRESPFVVLADMDYEILAANRTPITDRAYAFVFTPGRKSFTVVHHTQTPRTMKENLGVRGENRLACVACKTPATAANAQVGQSYPCHGAVCRGASKAVIEVPFLDGKPLW